MSSISKNMVQSEKFDTYEFYKFVRDEVRREDDLTNQRVASSLTFQGFLITASSYLITKFAEQPDLEIRALYILSILAIGLIGLILSFFSLMGVHAARKSISDLEKHWSEFNEIYNIYPSCAPQLLGQGSAFTWGSIYYSSVPGLLLLAWTIYLAVLVFFSIHGFQGVSGPIH